MHARKTSAALSLAALVCIAGQALVVTACRLDLVGVSGGLAGADAAAEDGAIDGMSSDDAASNDGGAGDAIASDGADAAGDAAADAFDASLDAGDAAPLFKCGAATVTDCAACAGAQFPCAYCGSGGAHDFRCVNLGGNHCIDLKPSGFNVCPCSALDASTCPLPYQVCHNTGIMTCRTCGEPNTVNQPSSDTSGCAGGGSCTASLTCN